MNDKKLSKLLSLALRHDPSALGITVDNHGWASVEALALAASVSIGDIKRVAAESDKKRFSISKNNQFIRAMQGHSINVDLGLEPVKPPEILYHGTASRFLESITETGLESRERKHVHLSSNTETAVQVGSRHGKPVVLSIRAEELHDAGQAFYLSENGVWLTSNISPDFIELPEAKQNSNSPIT